MTYCIRTLVPMRRLFLLIWAFAALLRLAPAAAEPAPQTLAFQDFFVHSSGPHGLALSPTLLAADGQRVTLKGYMVQQERAALGHFMLTPRPIQMSEQADGDADDLPLAWAMVYLDPEQENCAIPHSRGLLEITGVLHVGRDEGPDGRVSWVRLQLPAEATRGMNAFEVATYLHSLQHLH